MPILPSRNLRETLGFYERLGFENAGAEPERWDYLIVRRGDVCLHFFGMPEIARRLQRARVNSQPRHCWARRPICRARRR